MVEVKRPNSGELAHEFGALNTLLLVVLIGLCIFVAYLVKRYRFYYLPESAAAMMIGFVVGACAKVFYPSQQELEFLSFQSEIFFFLLLPPIILEAGYSLSQRRFFDNFGTILLFAVFGTVISTFVTGFVLYGAGQLGLVDVDTTSPLEALLFGALISAVDPVATLSIMGSRDLGCDPLLYSLVFGESVLNDAVCIGLFNTFLKEYKLETQFTYAMIWTAMVDFFGISLASVAVGILVGLGCAYMCKHTDMHDYPEFEISLLLLYAYASYAVAEVMHLSGIMSLFFCGIIMKYYNTSNLSKPSQVTTEYIFKSFARLAEFFVFIYMGMCFFTGQFAKWSVAFIFMAILACLLGRMANIYPLSWLANLRRSQQIPRNMQFVMWFCGLRGAMAFALAQTMPGNRKDLYVTTTLSVCVLTTLICGGLTEPLLGWTEMKQDSPKYSTELQSEREERSLVAESEDDEEYFLPDEIEVELNGGPEGSIDKQVPRRRANSGTKENEDMTVETIWTSIDEKYLRPLFINDERHQDNSSEKKQGVQRASSAIQEEYVSPVREA